MTRSPTRLLTLALCLSAACSDGDPISAGADNNVDKTPARWSELGATPDPRPDASLPDADVEDAASDAAEPDAGADATADASEGGDCSLLPVDVQPVSGVGCALDIVALPADSDPARYVVVLEGVTLVRGAASGYTLVTDRISFTGNACDALTESDAGLGAVIVSYPTCLNVE